MEMFYVLFHIAFQIWETVAEMNMNVTLGLSVSILRLFVTERYNVATSVTKVIAVSIDT